jgi:hypothetical protein
MLNNRMEVALGGVGYAGATAQQHTAAASWLLTLLLLQQQQQQHHPQHTKHATTTPLCL